MSSVLLETILATLVTNMMHPDHYEFIMKIVIAGIAALAASVSAKLGMAAAHWWRSI